MSISKIAKNAKNILERIDNGKSYPSGYVANKMESFHFSNPGDQLAANISQVIKKIASNRPVINESEIRDIYNKFYNFSNGDSNFRSEMSEFFGDESRISKTASAKPSIDRVGQDMSYVKIGGDSDLSKSFEKIFSLGKEKSFGTYDKSLDKRATKIVSLELKSMGLEPTSVSVSTGNSHFLLCNAQFKNSDFTTSNLNIPVQISSGSISLPNSMIVDGQISKLTKEAALVEIKNQQLSKRASGQFNYENMRDNHEIKMPTISLPENMKDMVDYETILAEASSGIDKSTLTKASSLVRSEIKSAGIPVSSVAFSSASNNRVLFLAKIATAGGQRDIFVPVELSGSKINMPSRFFDSSKNEYDFSSDGFLSFASSSKATFDKVASISRESDDMNRLSYQQLMDRVIAGVSNDDYRLSEDAISVIGNKFPEKIAHALEDFQNIIKKAAKKQSDDEIVKTAVKKGILIKRSNSIELFCPKLGLPLSKIDFDERGNPVPKHRSKSSKLESLGDISPSTNRLLK
jgi:hypothetical protein